MLQANEVFEDWLGVQIEENFSIRSSILNETTFCLQQCEGNRTYVLVTFLKEHKHYCHVVQVSRKQ